MIGYRQPIALWPLTIWLPATLIAWALISWRAALAVCLLCLLPGLIGHIRGLRLLVDWLKKPIDTPVPDGTGVWNFVFTALHHRVRNSSSQQETLTIALTRLQNAAEAMPDGIVLCDHQGHIEWMNRSAAAHFALDPTADRGQLLIHMVRTPGFIAFMKKAQYEKPFTYHSARVPGLTLLLNIVPFGEDQSMLIARDVSRLERYESIRRDFVANVSHELKTPLTVITGFAETLLDDPEEGRSEDAHHYLELIHEQSTRMHRIIQDLLSLAALENSPLIEKSESINVESLLNTIRRDAEELSNGRHDFDIHIDPSAPVILGCGTELHSAFANLVSNAIRYSPDGGHIGIVWHRSGNHVEFTVEDNGIGIASEHIPRLTERFYRADSGRSAKIGGTGLGLSIVKHVLMRHEADLRITSTPGKGSCFVAEFPETRVPVTAELGTA